MSPRRQILRAVAVGILTLTCAGVLAAQSIARAEALWTAKDYEAANNEFKALVAGQPKNADYRVRWGDLFYERFNPTDARKLYEEALELNPKQARAMLGIARIMADQDLATSFWGTWHIL